MKRTLLVSARNWSKEPVSLHISMMLTEKIQTDSQAAANNCRAATTLVLKPHLHLMLNTRIVVSNHLQDINLSLLHSSTLATGKNVIKAKSLVTRAQEQIKNCKKALFIVTHSKSPYNPCTLQLEISPQV